MDITVVYETLYGTTRALADTLAEGLRGADPQARVSVLPVDEASADRLSGTELLVVGGPTHALGMSRASTRRSGSEGKDADRAAGGTRTGVREWLAALPPAPPGARAAAFTTRLAYPLAGSAARGIARRLRRLGYPLVGVESFVVAGPTGPLRDGEQERARSWAARLGTDLARSRPHGAEGPTG